MNKDINKIIKFCSPYYPRMENGYLTFCCRNHSQKYADYKNSKKNEKISKSR